MNFHRYLFCEFLAKGCQVYVCFDREHAGVDVPGSGPGQLVFGAGVPCGGLGADNDAIRAELQWNGGKDHYYVTVPWASVIKVSTPFADEWQVVAGQRLASTDC
jgi:hypothetical protein